MIIYSVTVLIKKDVEDSWLKWMKAVLSGQGIEITTKGLLEGIKQLKKELPIFSREDLTGLVGGLAIKTKDLKYSEQHILDLAKAIAILHVRSTEVETLDQTTGKVVTVLLSGTTRGISGLGLQMDDATIRAEAMAENLLKAGEGVEDLSKTEKDLVKLNIILKSVGGETIAIQEYMSSSAGIIQQNAAAWKDMQAQVGTFLTSIVPLMTPFISIIESGVIAVKSLWIALEGLEAVVKSTIVPLFDLLKSGLSVENIREFANTLITEIPKAFKDKVKLKVNDLFPEAPDSELFDYLFGDFYEYKDTPTSPAVSVAEETEKAAEAIENSEEKILHIMSDARDKRLQIDEGYRRKIEDANRDHA